VSKRRDRPYQFWQVEAPAEDQEPQASGDEPGDGFFRANCHVGANRPRRLTTNNTYETAMIAMSALGDNPDDICSD